MITEEEKQEIIDKAVEKALLLIPETIGNLMAEHASLSKLNAKFYKDYPEFREHKAAVIAALEKVDMQDTLLPYEEKLRRAVPEIRERIKLGSSLDMQTMKRPNRDVSMLKSDPGEL